jgi:hypothetical protein
MRNPILADRDEFAVDHGVTLHAFESFRDLDVAVTDDLAVATIQSDLAAFDICNYAKSVVFVFENPLVIIERFICQRGKHRRKAFRQGRRPAHAYASLSSKLRNVIE